MSGRIFGAGNLFVQGNVGIGTTNAASGLHVIKTTGGASPNWYDPANFAATVHQDFDATQHYGLLVSDRWRAPENVVFAVGGRYSNLSGSVADDYHNPYLVVRGLGNVGIGTANPQSLLAVNGTITTKEVVVTATGWPDYIFDTGRRLAPLAEVAAYIGEHHHLPEIPSAIEVQNKGVGLGDMQVKLLSKIEELTLHAIEAEARNRDLLAKIEGLTRHLIAAEDRNLKLEKRVDGLEAH